MKKLEYVDQRGTFRMESPENISYLYFPIANEAGVLSCVTPLLGGDSKTSQNTFLLEPVSAENLHNNRSSRNFWLHDGTRAWSACGVSAAQMADIFSSRQEKTALCAGLLWHQVTRIGQEVGLTAEITFFAPVSGEQLELMKVTVKNHTTQEKTLVPTAAIPLYGRSADNLRDHRHVTSLLHRTYLTRNGVFLHPTLTFDERGHRENQMVYGVMGVTGDGKMPTGFFPVTEEYIGEGGNFEQPRAVMCNEEPHHRAGEEMDGYETTGAIRFPKVTLQPEESACWLVGMGYGASKEELTESFSHFDSIEKFDRALEENKRYWQEQVTVFYETGSPDFDNWMYWVNFQPMLRRMYGCSFLPHHDYGRGGRGWRDLWQDCLALLMMNPDGVRQMLYDNFGGVRMDGTNATIIGSSKGEFVADRNGITRVWMDHGMWPFLTTQLYLNQSGDFEFLLAETTYFKDWQVCRGEEKDEKWQEEQGKCQHTVSGEVYQGTVLEHLLLQHLTAFYDVGEHNNIRLRGADWNDALDMAKERGESVVFTGMYGDNLERLANLIVELAEKKHLPSIALAEEIEFLLEDDMVFYEKVAEKQALLMHYCERCKHTVSGKKVEVSVARLAGNLRHKAIWLKNHIRRNEWVTDGMGRFWFNGYYDNSGSRVEGGRHMMLAGQVFSIMSGVATDDQIKDIVKAADTYLYRKEVGGYRLNTDFKELKTNLGRMFAFAYGMKENGAVFSHMTVMYANALYQRGFVKEGYKALMTLIRHCMDTEKSKIYPGIPEYIDPKGRGLYHYLTGSASWMLLTVVTEMFGIKGYLGDLVLNPKLLAEQFAENGKAGIHFPFAGRRVYVEYRNPKHLELGLYQITRLEIDGRFHPHASLAREGVCIKRKVIEEWKAKKEHKIVAILG